jgi:hypothetical protein
MEIDTLKARIALLEAAIRKHKHDVDMHYVATCDTVSPEDAALWAVLQEDKPQ